MKIIPGNIQKLIDELAKLPSIGSKTASRLTFYLLKSSDKELEDLGRAVLSLREGITFCQICYNFTDQDICPVCNDKSRDEKIICVVSEPLDVVAFEKTGFFGVYHVLGGVISPVEGVGPHDIHIAELIKRIKENQPKEIVLATNPDLEGETTALYIQKELKEKKIDEKLIITRIARGLPVGGDLEYADEVTLSRAMEGRREY